MKIVVILLFLLELGKRIKRQPQFLTLEVKLGHHFWKKKNWLIRKNVGSECRCGFLTSED